MSGRLLANQGLANDHRLHMSQIEHTRKSAAAKKSTTGDEARPEWAISSYLLLAQKRRMARLRALFSTLIPNTRMP